LIQQIRLILERGRDPPGFHCLPLYTVAAQPDK
jgi:hypothetical protein